MINSKNGPLLIKCVDAFVARPRNPKFDYGVHADWTLAATAVGNCLDTEEYSLLTPRDLSVLSKIIRYAIENNLFSSDRLELETLFTWCREQAPKS